MSSKHPDKTPLSAALVLAWRKDAEHDPDRQGAYLRFLQKRPSRGRVRLLHVAGWLVAGMLLGMGSLYAATGAPWRLLVSGSSALERRRAAELRPSPAA